MGLDMCIFTREGTLPASVDFKMTDSDLILHTWRNHWDLHTWMEDVYREKGGTEAEFNGVNLQLTDAELDWLDGTELPDDVLFIAKARSALSAGLSVFYTSCW